MKGKLLIILLFAFSGVFGQSVPDTNTFTLQDVVDAVNPTTDDLVDCFADSNAAYFDPTYGSKTMSPQTLYGFRNYALTYTCGGTAEFSGVNTYPSIFRVSLGSSTGTVVINYDMYEVPDLLLVYFDGSQVASTGFKGDQIYDYGGDNRSSFNSAMNGRYYPGTSILVPDITVWTQDGYPRILSGGGSGSVSFSKNTSTIYCYVYVYAPMTYTAWEVSVGCP